ncbi:hypothetical protein BDZ89DRAFT_1081235 [Hymenopellis radicata]|nr:hypothetical protein BDZ89DRAFT_1081235 [Hymenopellis radicata]
MAPSFKQRLAAARKNLAGRLYRVPRRDPSQRPRRKVVPDPSPTPACLRKDTPTSNHGYVTPEERDVTPNDPRPVIRENKMDKYMDEHNERSTKLAKGAALNLKAHQSANSSMHQSSNTLIHQSSSTLIHQSPNIPMHQSDDTASEAEADVGGKRARSATVIPEPCEEPLRKRRRMKGRSKKGSTTDQTTPPLRRSTRTPKIPPKYT